MLHVEYLIDGADATVNINEEIEKISPSGNAYNLNSEGDRFEFCLDADNSVGFRGLFQIPS